MPFLGPVPISGVHGFFNSDHCYKLLKVAGILQIPSILQWKMDQCVDCVALL